MAKKKRVVVASFYKAQELTEEQVQRGEKQNSPYLKFKEDVTFKKGQCVSVENKKYQLESLMKAHAAGKVSSESMEKIRKRIEDMPDFVIAEVVAFRE